VFISLDLFCREADYVPNQLLRGVHTAGVIKEARFEAGAWEQAADENTFHDCSILVIRRRTFKRSASLALARKMKAQGASFAVVELGAEGAGCNGLGFKRPVEASSFYILEITGSKTVKPTKK
jgi:hypothetical protein